MTIDNVNIHEMSRALRMVTNVGTVFVLFTPEGYLAEPRSKNGNAKQYRSHDRAMAAALKIVRNKKEV
jgi:hypothetical protein